MCGLAAGQRGGRVRVIEHANRVGKKILMSGGGRCNFTNLNVKPENNVTRTPPCMSIVFHSAGSGLSMRTSAHTAAATARPGARFTRNSQCQE